jgi:hypothetical protein
MKYKSRDVVLVIIGSLLVLTVFFIGALAMLDRTSTVPTVSVPPITTSTTPSQEPLKTDFGQTIPPNFPGNLLIEKEVVPSQSYQLDYDDQEQTTMVFSSLKTVKETYTEYFTTLEKEGWSISNQYEGEIVSALYGAKGNMEINVTISTDAGGSQVSVSVLTTNDTQI